METANDSRPVISVTYDGQKWVEAWNLTAGIAAADPTIRGYRLADGEEILR